MTKREKFMQDIQYAIDYKIDRFFIKSETDNYKGLSVTIYPNCDLEQIKKDMGIIPNEDLSYSNGRIVSWGEFSINEDKYIKNVVLGDELGEDIYNV